MHPFIFVTGLPLSGKSFIGGVLHHLGVPMAYSYYSPERASYNWYEDVTVRGGIGHPETNTCTQELLDSYIAKRREAHPDGPVGVKWMNPRFLVENGVPENSRIVMCHRPLSAVVKRYEDPELAVHMYGWLNLLDKYTLIHFGLDVRGSNRMETVYSLAETFDLVVTEEARDFAKEVPNE